MGPPVGSRNLRVRVEEAEYGDVVILVAFIFRLAEVDWVDEPAECDHRDEREERQRAPVEKS